jgi:hypothetical protein
MFSLLFLKEKSLLTCSFPSENVSRCYDGKRKKWGTLTKIDASTGGVRVLFDGNSNAIIISPDDLVGTAASHSALAAGEIQPATKQRPEVETTRNNDFAGRKRPSTFVEGFETSESTVDKPSSDDLRESSSGNQMEAPHVGGQDQASMGCSEPSPDDIAVDSANDDDGDVDLDDDDDEKTLEMWKPPNEDEVAPVDDDPDSMEMMESPKEQQTVTRQCSGPSVAEETPPSPFRINPDDEYSKPKKNELITYVWHRPSYYRTGVHLGKDHIAFYNESTLDDGTLDVYSDNFHLTKKRFQDGDFRIRHDLPTGCRCYDAHRKRWGILTAIEASRGGVRVLFDGNSNAILISPDDLVGTARPTSSGEIQSAAPQDSDLQTTCKRNRKPSSSSIQSLEELQNQRGRIASSPLVRGSKTSLRLEEGSTDTEPLREIDDDLQEFPSGNQAEALDLDLETHGMPDGDDDVSYQTSWGCSGPALAKSTECNGPLLPHFEMQPIDESQSGRDEHSDDETSQESTVPSPFRPHPDDEYVKPRRNEFASYLWKKPDFFRTGLLQSTDRITFYEGTRDDGTLDVYSERFELNKKRFKDGYFRARSDLVLDG